MLSGKGKRTDYFLSAAKVSLLNVEGYSGEHGFLKIAE